MDGIINFMRSVIPTGSTEIAWGGISAVGGALLSNFLGWGKSIEVLLVAMVIDYITGILAAYINPRLALSSQKGFKGICKKIIIILLVALAHELDKITGQPLVQTMVVWFFIGNEGLSILENAGKAGLPIPKKLRDTLEQLATEKGEMKK